MKKKIIITIVAVIAVMAASLGITYAAWDKGSDKKTLDATVGGNIDIMATVINSGNANENVLVPTGTDGVNSAKMTDVLTLGTVKVTNNVVDGVSTDKENLRIVWDLVQVNVTREGTTDAVAIDLNKFKGIFDVEIQYGGTSGSASTTATYGQNVPLDTELSVLMKFIENHEAIDGLIASEFRNAKFAITVEFRAEIVNSVA